MIMIGENLLVRMRRGLFPGERYVWGMSGDRCVSKMAGAVSGPAPRMTADEQTEKKFQIFEWKGGG